MICVTILSLPDIIPRVTEPENICDEWYEAYKTFYLDTENIPVGHYKLEYVFQNAKYYFTERNIDVI